MLKQAVRILLVGFSYLLAPLLVIWSLLVALILGLSSLLRSAFGRRDSGKKRLHKEVTEATLSNDTISVDGLLFEKEQVDEIGWGLPVYRLHTSAQIDGLENSNFTYAFQSKAGLFLVRRNNGAARSIDASLVYLDSAERKLKEICLMPAYTFEAELLDEKKVKFSWRDRLVKDYVTVELKAG
jgi:hypothetical protein